MLRPRLVVSLLIHDGGLVKTQQFGSHKYVGDPLNAVRIFNEKEVDELAVFDIDATTQRREPQYRLIEALANECRMPLCYGGGVSTAAQAQRIIQLGVEKVAVSNALISNPALATEMAALVGAQSVAAVLDVRFNPTSGHYEAFTHNGRALAHHDAVTLAHELERAGAGEIIVNSIDRDGTRTGYDMRLLSHMTQATTIPMSFLGGVGNLDHIRTAAREHGAIGYAAGSQFVFKGSMRAVLINYPNPQEKSALFSM